MTELTPTTIDFPGEAAKYATYNLLPDAQVDALADLLVSREPRRIALLSGLTRHDKLYLVESAAYHAAQRGAPTRVGEISLADFEPDRQTPAEFVALLLEQETAREKGRRDEARQEIRGIVEQLQGKLTFGLAAGLALSLSLGTKALALFRRVLRGEAGALPGPALGTGEALHLLLRELTRESQLVLFVPGLETLPGTLVSELTHAYKQNRRVVLAFGCVDARTARVGSWDEPVSARVALSPHDARSLRAALDRRFPANDFPPSFADRLLRTSGGSPWMLAGLLQWLGGHDVIVPTERGAWRLADPAALDDEEEALASVLPLVSRDRERVDRLRVSDDPLDRVVRDVVLRAVLCGPLVPIRRVVESLEAVSGGGHDADDVMDRLDALFGDEAEPADALFRSHDYGHPGFPPDVLVYAFSDEITRWALGGLMTPAERRSKAVFLLGHLTARMSTHHRAAAALMLRLARESGDETVAERWERRLRWWVSLDESDALESLVVREIDDGAVLPEVVWEAGIAMDGAPQLRLGLLNAYESWGMPVDRRAFFHHARGAALEALKDHPRALADFRAALAACPPEDKGLLCEIHLGLCSQHRFRDAWEAGREHGETALRLARELSGGLPTLATAVCNLALADLLYQKNADAALAQAYAAAAVRTCDEMVKRGFAEPQDPMRLQALTLLARSTRDPERRMALMEEFLALAPLTLGEDHGLVTAVTGELAALFRDRGEWGKAERLRARQVASLTRALGEDDDETVAALREMAVVLAELDEHDRARAIQETVLGHWRKHYGESAPRSLLATGDLACTLRELGELERAREMEEGVLATLDANDDGAGRFVVMANLALTLEKLDELERARALLDDAVAGMRRILGEDHLLTLRAAGSLSTLMHAQGEVEAGRALAERVVEDRLRALGENHPDTHTAMDHLGNMLREAGDLPRAREMEEKTLAGRIRTFGPDDPSTLAAARHLSKTLVLLGEIDRARELREQVVDVRRRTLGDDHPDTRKAIDALAELASIQAGGAEVPPAPAS